MNVLMIRLIDNNVMWMKYIVLAFRVVILALERLKRRFVSITAVVTDKHGASSHGPEFFALPGVCPMNARFLPV